MPDENWEVEKSRNWAISEQKRLEIVKTNGRKIEKLSLQCGPKVMEPNLEKLWVNFWPIYAKKMAIFEAKNVEANLENIWVKFWPIYAKKWPFFLGKKRRPILNNFWPIYAKKMAIFSRQKKEANFEQCPHN